MLFVQGSRDAFGTPDELRRVLATLAADAELHVVTGLTTGSPCGREARHAAAQAGSGPPGLAGDVLTGVWTRWPGGSQSARETTDGGRG